MPHGATVSCKVCGYEVTVSQAATMWPDLLNRELPAGWVVRRERDEAKGKQIVVVYCPKHKQT
jgi:hypothetical protein